MKPLLIMPYDDNRKIVGDVAAIAAKRWAEKFGFDFLCGKVACAWDNPWFYKIPAAMANSNRPFVVVADADVVMRPNGELPSSSGKIQMSQNWAGLCSGFFMAVSTSETFKLLGTWLTLGESIHERYDHSPHDEATLKILTQNFKWANDAIERIPTSLVSSPENGIIGTLAHHFVASVMDQNECAKKMMELIEEDGK